MWTDVHSLCLLDENEVGIQYGGSVNKMVDGNTLTHSIGGEGVIGVDFVYADIPSGKHIIY